MLARFDENKNGRLDPAELAKLRRTIGQNGQKGKRPQLSPQIQARLKERFDANKNGQLDPPELAKLRAALPQLRREFQKNNATDRKKGADRKKGDARKQGADRPGNRDIPRQILQRFDRNKNGKLDPEELARLREARQAQGQAGRRSRSRTQQTVEPRKNRVDQTEALKRFDANNNGKLDGAERQKALEALNQKRD